MKREQLFNFLKQCATLGRIGYLPAPGTAATLVTLPIVVLLKFIIAPRVEFFVVLIVTLVSGFIIEKVLQLLPVPRVSSEMDVLHDPPQIVLDEVVGCLWAFYGISLTWKKLVIGFLLFRFFDIFKPLGIDYLQKLPRAWGILADDIVAGLYTALVLFFI